MKTFARAALAIVGGYVGTSTVIAALAVIAVTTGGMERSEAATLGAMLGFAIYLAVIIWSFAERALLRVALGLGTVSALSYALVLLLSRTPG